MGCRRDVLITTTRRAAVRLTLLGSAATAVACGPHQRFERLATADCIVERIAFVPGEYHFSFQGISPDGARLVVGYSARRDTVRGSYLVDLDKVARRRCAASTTAVPSRPMAGISLRAYMSVRATPRSWSSMS
jgi:hypothetical protein